MLTKTYGSSVQGIDARTITVEVNVSMGAKFYIVGLADNAVKESQQRIESAIKNNDFNWPGYRIVVNLAPADIRKEGSAYDLPLAIGVLSASGQMKKEKLGDYVLMGELSLDGSLQRIRGVLPMAVTARKDGFKGLILPSANALEAAVVKDLKVIGVENLTEVVGFLNGNLELMPVVVDSVSQFNEKASRFDNDFSEVKGQENVKRALEIAAAGGHNLVMIGPPGAGKTMLAKRLPTILPPLTIEEALETTKIHSVAGKISRENSLITRRPFRNPHHTISDIALTGGGNFPQPGEISLAHNGVLFLDELPEFKRNVLEVMRQPLEDRVISISRARYTIEYPASFMMVASMNPCPCGYFNHPDKPCQCGPGMVKKYLNRISGPLMDRIDIHIEIVPVPFRDLAELREAESSEQIRERVVNARNFQSERFRIHRAVYCNAQMSSKLLRKYCRLDEGSARILKNAMEKLGLSARAYDRILKVSRTIADLEGSEQIEAHHISEAINYRNLDREGWAGT
ncbi:MAG: YifB family Mg chelatase-like AAA ATPase [Bacteroidales bacterium]|nr:YifB family Mg chelatase-like AAA ATPase [Bacteroidales bacterium]